MLSTMAFTLRITKLSNANKLRLIAFFTVLLIILSIISVTLFVTKNKKTEVKQASENTKWKSQTGSTRLANDGLCGGFEKYKSYYSVNSNSVYVGDGFGSSSLPLIDAPSFKYLGYYLDTGGMYRGSAYALDKNHVYKECGEVLENADPNTFTDLGEGYAKDKMNVWYIGSPINNAEPQFFTVLGSGYGKDNKYSYIGNQIIHGADIKSFRIGNSSETPPYSFDKNHVYNNDTVIENADPNTFTILDRTITKDTTHVWVNGILLEEARPASFRALNTNFNTDDTHIYFMSIKMKDVDPQTFTVFGDSFYAKDKNHIYYQSEIIPDADLATFLFIGTYDAKDKNNNYNRGEIVR